MGEIEGVININKPPGISSRETGEKVKEILKVKKVGHAGTLDPMARGVLLILVGNASKLSQFLTALDKVYLFRMKLGERRLTGDATGEVIERKPVPELSRERIEEVLQKFRGEILQSPHPFSAVKYRGRPLYKYAREGNLIKLEPRKVYIREIELVDFTEDEIAVKVTTSSGVYIRTLAEEIGRELGSVAYLSYLNRLRVGRFQLEDSVTLEALEESVKRGDVFKHIIPMVEVIDMRKIKVNRQVASLVLRGVPISQILGARFEIIEPGEKFAIISENGKKLYAIAEKGRNGTFRYVRVFTG